MRVLQLGDDLCLSLEAADEIRVVGILGQDNLDRHFAAHSGLIGAIHGAKTARPNVFL